MKTGRTIAPSLEDSLLLAEKIASGAMGPATMAAFSGVSLAMEEACATSAIKEALADDAVNESDDDSRKRRLAELLKRREHSGLVTGSAHPTPPRDNS
jgi:hypothetical protein